MPGYTNYFYKNGVPPSHTKPAFTNLNILTVHNLILKNVLIFMNKIHRYPELMPISILNTIPKNSPVPGSTHEMCAEWLQNYGSKSLSNTVYYKGPLLFSDITLNTNNAKSYTSMKHIIKKYLFDVQRLGNEEEWLSNNFKLYNINGLRQSARLNNLNPQQL